MEVLIKEYPNIFINVVEQVSKHTNLISCSERVIEKITRRIINYVDNDKSKITHKLVINRIIHREIAQAYTEKKKEIMSTSFINMSSDENNESLEFEPVDISTNVEHSVVEKTSIKEKLDNLSSNASELFVLNAWSQGFNDTEISKELSSRFGGNPKSLRVWIQRFRTRCQRKLNEQSNSLLN